MAIYSGRFFSPVEVVPPRGLSLAPGASRHRARNGLSPWPVRRWISPIMPRLEKALSAITAPLIGYQGCGRTNVNS